MRRALLVLLLAVATALAAAAPAGAHTPPPRTPSTRVTAPALVEPPAVASAIPSTALAVLLTLAVAVVSLRRRTLVGMLVVVVGLLAFEAGLHATHHLGQPDDAAGCAIAAVAAQLNADVVDAPSGAPRALVVAGVVLAPGAPVRAARAVAPRAGRAPPALVA